MPKNTIFISFVFTLIMTVSFAGGSPVVPTPIYTGEQILPNETLWSPDSQSLIFTGIDNGKTYYRYGVNDGLLEAFDQSPTIQLLSDVQQQIFNAADDVAHVSHDGRYAIYIHQDEICGSEVGCGNRLALADLQLDEHVYIDSGLLASRWFIWSDESNAALMIGQGYYGGVSGIWHITNFTSDLKQVESILLMNYYAGTHIYVDISSDGERVLLRHFETGLYVWDVTVPYEPQQFAATESLVILQGRIIAGASFMPDNKDEVIAVTDEGIITLNILNGESEILNSTIHSSWVEWTYFSPDNQYIAVIPSVESGFACQLFVLPIDFSGDVDTMLNIAPQCAFYG